MNPVDQPQCVENPYLNDVSLPLRVHLGGREVTMTEIQALQSGVVLPLNTVVGAPLDLFVANIRFATVEVVVRDGLMSARVIELLQSTQPAAGHGLGNREQQDEH